MTRVAYKSTFDANRFNLGRISERMQDATTVMGSGKRINSVKDDPVGLTQVLKLKSNLSDLGQVTRNISTGRTWLTAGETALTQTQDILTSCKELCVQYRNATVGATERVNAAKIVNGYLLNMVAVSNTTVAGQYIFSGTKTDTAPFALDDRNHPTAATYSGNTVAFAVKTGKDLSVDVGHDGDAVFGNIFSTLIDLKSALENNDTAGIGTALSALDVDFNSIVGNMSQIGVKDIRLDTREKIISELDIRYTENRSEIEEIDLVEAVSDLKAAELAYQAALSSSAKIMQLSLANFM